MSMYFLLLCASSLAGFSRYRNPLLSEHIIGALPLKSFFQKNRFEIAMHLSLLTYSWIEGGMPASCTLNISYGLTRGQGPVSRKARKLFGPESKF